jgi:hypothetical protein
MSFDFFPSPKSVARQRGHTKVDGVRAPMAALAAPFSFSNP